MSVGSGVRQSSLSRFKVTISPAPKFPAPILMVSTTLAAMSVLSMWEPTTTRVPLRWPPWWRAEGRRIYPEAKSLLITADGGGSNGWRLRLWKLELQKFADQTAMGIAVCHFPPGTSKWNKIEHRLFSFISSNWRGEPLRDYETIVNLIAR